MPKAAIALFWHQHQPYYPDDVAGVNPMPWVRFHGTKDYIGMALHLDEVPEFHCTVNLVPSLLVQLEAYVQGATDRHLTVSRIPADGLSRDDGIYLMDHFFMAYYDTMIGPYERYAELHALRGVGIDNGADALNRFREVDLRDLQVWSNLAWFHPLLFERDPALREFAAKGRYYSESDKDWLLDQQKAILAEILPYHKKLADRGQIELTTTPFYHPILPLLLDKRLAREAMPGVTLPQYSGGYPEDAEEQVRRAVVSHQQRFGSPPRGMWPSEGSVCQSMIPLLARHGIRWIATDEEILSCSTHGHVSRDGKGYVKNPEKLYRSWRIAEAGDELAIVFRDHALSDQIGFHYQRSHGDAAAADFLAKTHAIRDACHNDPQTLISVILDGENCWEYYPDGGVSFLRALYRGIARDQHTYSTTVGAHLQNHPPRETLGRLFSGSWISHNFAIWIGHPEDNAGWDVLHSTREFLLSQTPEQPNTSGHTPETIAKARDELLIAEGSDWFWWYGDDHSSPQDGLFDELFRKHLRNVYELFGAEPPSILYEAISRSGKTHSLHEQPQGFSQVKIDGRHTYFEWSCAVRMPCDALPEGAMAQVARGLTKDLWFGFDAKNLFIRLDTHHPAGEALAQADQLRITFLEPQHWEVSLRDPAQPRPKATIRHEGRIMHQGNANGKILQAATDLILELSLPFSWINRLPNDPIRFYLELLQGETSLERIPRAGIVRTTAPGPEFEQIHWQV